MRWDERVEGWWGTGTGGDEVVRSQSESFASEKKSIFELSPYLSEGSS